MDNPGGAGGGGRDARYPVQSLLSRSTAQGLRIAFMERSASGKKQHGRSAVLLNVATATQLRDMLSQFLPPAETIQ